MLASRARARPARTSDKRPLARRAYRIIGLIDGIPRGLAHYVCVCVCVCFGIWPSARRQASGQIDFAPVSAAPSLGIGAKMGWLPAATKWAGSIIFKCYVCQAAPVGWSAYAERKTINPRLILYDNNDNHLPIGPTHNRAPACLGPWPGAGELRAKLT